MARKSSGKQRNARQRRGNGESTRPSTPAAWADNLPSDGLLVQVGAPDVAPADAATLAESIAAGMPGEWIVRPLGKESREFTFRRPPGKKNPTAAQAWDLSYTLRQHRDVANCEPALFLPVDGPPAMLPKSQQRAAEAFRARASGAAILGDEEHEACSEPTDWALKLCRVPEAWGLTPPTGGKAQGEGIVVGHPDTGYTRHPQIDDPSRLLADQGYDFEDGDDDPTDDLSGFSGGHGTSTASVIMSGPVGDVTGAAPKSKLVPIRTTNSVVLFSFARLAEALYFAADNAHHAVSISLGGAFPSGGLRRAVEYAVARGVIVLAAAGNYVPFVVYPAALDEVIAVAACNCSRGEWAHSSSGSAVDITAPGESVWRAITDDDGYDTGRSSGTSYAVAMTAGVAALWLAFQGRQNLIDRYGLANVPSVFKELLTTQGFTRPAGWDTADFGPGILDAHKLLSAPLPATAPAARFAPVRAAAVPRAMNQFDQFMCQFPGKSPTALRAGLRRLLDVPEQDLEAALAEVGPEIGYHLATNLAFRRQLLSTPPGPTAVAKSAAMKSSIRPILQKCGSNRLRRMLRN